MLLPLNTTGSNAIEDLRVNPLTGSAQVTFWKSWPTYQLTHISRRALLKGWVKNRLGLMPSVGEWTNEVVLEGYWKGCL